MYSNISLSSPFWTQIMYTLAYVIMLQNSSALFCNVFLSFLCFINPVFSLSFLVLEFKKNFLNSFSFLLKSLTFSYFS